MRNKKKNLTNFENLGLFRMNLFLLLGQHLGGHPDGLIDGSIDYLLLHPILTPPLAFLHCIPFLI